MKSFTSTAIAALAGTLGYTQHNVEAGADWLSNPRTGDSMKIPNGSVNSINEHGTRLFNGSTVNSFDLIPTKIKTNGKVQNAGIKVGSNGTTELVTETDAAESVLVYASAFGLPIDANPLRRS